MQFLPTYRGSVNVQHECNFNEFALDLVILTILCFGIFANVLASDFSKTESNKSFYRVLA